jgi:hypothetical protein
MNFIINYISEEESKSFNMMNHIVLHLDEIEQQIKNLEDDYNKLLERYNALILCYKKLTQEES